MIPNQKRLRELLDRQSLERPRMAETVAPDKPAPECQGIQSPQKKCRDPVYVRDRRFYRVVGWGLVTAVLFALLGSIGLAAYGKEVPEAVVIGIGSAALGVLRSALTINCR